MAIGGKSVVRFKIKAEGAKTAEKDLKGVSDKVKGFGDIVKGSASGLAAFGPHAAAAAAAIAAVGAAAALAAKAVTTLANALVGLIARGSEFAAIAAGFERIADPALLQRFQELSGHHIRQRDLMVQYQRVVEAGVATSDQFAEALDLITARAQQTGENVTTMLERMAPMLQGRGIEQVTDLGVQTGVLNDALREAGISAESARGQTERLTLALRLAREQIGETDNAATNLGDAYEALTVNANDYLDTMGRVVAESPALVDSFEAMRIALNQVGIEAGSMGEIVARVMRSVVIRVTRDVTAITTFAIMVVDAVNSIERATGIDLARMLPGGQVTLNALRQGLEDIRITAHAGLIAAMEGAVTAPVQERREQQRRGGRGAGAGTAEELTAAQAADEEFFNDIILLRQEIERELEEQRREFHRNQKDRIAQINEFWTNLDQENSERQERWHDMQMQAARERMDALEEEAERWTDFKDAQDEAAEATQERTMQTIQNVGKMASATQTIFNSVSQVIGAIGGDTEKAAKQQGAFLIAFSGVMAAVELAQSIKAFASQQYVEGAAHLASMAAFIAAAAQAASDLGGGTSKTPSGGTTFTPAQTERVQAPETGDRSITIIEAYSFGRSSSDIGRTVREADWAFQSSGEVSGRGLSAEFGA
jgi:hypothetical protein